MRWNGFGRTLLFAALAGAGTAPWIVFVAPLLGTRAAIAAWLVGTTAVYVGGLAPDRRRRVAALAAALAAGCALAAVTRTLAELSLGLAVVLATARSGFLHRAAPARAVATECLLVGAGLLFARFLAGPSPASAMLAVWGFFLVQGAFFLVGGVRPRGARPRHPDPFEEAHARALSLFG